jgi:hypothetical protein
VGLVTKGINTHGQGATPELGHVADCRVVVCDEAGNQRIDATTIKQIVGGGEITYRFMRSDRMLTTACDFLLILSGNVPPRYSVRDATVISREITVNFRICFVEQLDANSGPNECLANPGAIEELWVARHALISFFGDFLSLPGEYKVFKDTHVAVRDNAVDESVQDMDPETAAAAFGSLFKASMTDVMTYSDVDMAWLVFQEACAARYVFTTAMQSSAVAMVVQRYASDKATISRRGLHRARVYTMASSSACPKVIQAFCRGTDHPADIVNAITSVVGSDARSTDKGHQSTLWGSTKMPAVMTTQLGTNQTRISMKNVHKSV